MLDLIFAFLCGGREIENAVRSGKRNASVVVAVPELAEFVEDEAGIGVGREASLKWLEVVEFDGGRGRKERGGSNTGGN
jgi:hypothetical protein